MKLEVQFGAEFDSHLTEIIRETVTPEVTKIVEEQLNPLLNSLHESLIQAKNMREEEANLTKAPGEEETPVTPWLTSAQTAEFMGYTNYRMRWLRRNARSLGVSMQVEGRTYRYNRADLQRYKESITL